jgi:hypothetical protein
VFLLAEALTEAGVLVGLPRPTAAALVTQTLLGAATLLAETGDSPESLRAAVTSPGGTTAAGLQALEAHGVRAPDPARDRPPTSSKVPSRREQLKDGHVAGRSTQFTRDDMRRMVRELLYGHEAASLGVGALADLTTEQASAAIEMVTLVAFESACERVLEVGRRGGRLVFATARPASLLGVYRALAAAAIDAGGVVLEAAQSSLVDRVGYRLWWLDGVAVVTDGENLLAHDSAAAADELFFVLARPDLVVADGWFAGSALAAGLEVVACADLDAVALAVAAWRGMAIRVVPLDERRPPQAYLPLVDTLHDVVAASDLDDPLVVLAGRSGTVGPRSVS